MLLSHLTFVQCLCPKAGTARLNHYCNAAELKAATASAWPAEKTIYDWCYSHETGGWVDWMATVPPFTPDPDASFSQIIVPTSDTVCYNYLLRSLVAAGKHVLYVGETGTGNHTCGLHWQQLATIQYKFTVKCIKRFEPWRQYRLHNDVSRT